MANMTSNLDLANQRKEMSEKIIEKDLLDMVLSNDKDILKFFEVFSSAILLSLNEKLPEPNYSIYMTYRIKSPKSTASKIPNYLSNSEDNNGKISIKDFSDLVGMRIIVEKIPHNVTLHKSHPEYDVLKQMQLFRKQNSMLSFDYHDFEVDVLENNCTSINYYTKCKELINDIVNILDQDKESKNYAIDLKKTYSDLLKKCDEKLNYIKVIGNYDSKIDYNSIKKDVSQAKSNDIDFCKLLSDFDSRIDSQLALKLYSVTLPDIIKNSPFLQKLGISVNESSDRTKCKREKSGYVANFFGLDIEGIPINCECQIMSIDEHLSSILGYSAHSKMPGKDPIPAEIPPAYVNRLMTQYSEIGNENILSFEQLKLLSKLIKIKNLNKDELKVLSSILSNSSKPEKQFNDIASEDQKFIIDEKLLPQLKKICIINDEQKSNLEEKLYQEGKQNFSSWAKNISACHVTARLDKDSSAKDRVKIHYDNPYECIAHVMRQQVEGYNFDSFNSKLVELYLGRIYKHQNEWLNNFEISKESNSIAEKTYVEGSVMNFEIKEYIVEDLPKLKSKVNGLIDKETNIRNSNTIEDSER